MASRWCTPTFCRSRSEAVISCLGTSIGMYGTHWYVWECCKPFKRKQHKDTLGNNIKGLYEHSMWNCWCLACVEASRLGVLEATIFPTLQGNFAYAAKTWYQVTCQWYSDTYIYIYTSGTKNQWNRRVWENNQGFTSKPRVLKIHDFQNSWISVICHDLFRLVILLFEIVFESLIIFEQVILMPYDVLHR